MNYTSECNLEVLLNLWSSLDTRTIGYWVADIENGAFMQECRLCWVTNASYLALGWLLFQHNESKRAHDYPQPHTYRWHDCRFIGVVIYIYKCTFFTYSLTTYGYKCMCLARFHGTWNQHPFVALTNSSVGSVELLQHIFNSGSCCCSHC